MDDDGEIEVDALDVGDLEVDGTVDDDGEFEVEVSSYVGDLEIIIAGASIIEIGMGTLPTISSSS